VPRTRTKKPARGVFYPRPVGGLFGPGAFPGRHKIFAGNNFRLETSSPVYNTFAWRMISGCRWLVVKTGFCLESEVKVNSKLEKEREANMKKAIFGVMVVAAVLLPAAGCSGKGVELNSKDKAFLRGIVAVFFADKEEQNVLLATACAEDDACSAGCAKELEAYPYADQEQKPIVLLTCKKFLEQLKKNREFAGKLDGLLNSQGELDYEKAKNLPVKALQEEADRFIRGNIGDRLNAILGPFIKEKK
jgi:hypothetical protein